MDAPQMLHGTRRYKLGSDRRISIADASRNGATFNWHSWMLLLFDRQTRSAHAKPGCQKGFAKYFPTRPDSTMATNTVQEWVHSAGRVDQGQGWRGG